jgi:hypothetical protein
MYQTQRMKYLVGRNFGEGKDGFRAMLFEKAEKIDGLYRGIMEQTEGDPLGLEFKQPDSDRWAFLVPEMSSPEDGKFRIQYFDKKGFYSHSTQKTMEEALETMLNEGFHEQDRGALDRLSRDPAWRRGSEVGALLQRLNGRCITHKQFEAELAVINSRYEIA